jgi:hypothetical protein
VSKAAATLWRPNTLKLVAVAIFWMVWLALFVFGIVAGGGGGG